MIQYKDFTPEVLSSAGFFSLASYEQLHSCVTRANDWIDSSGASVINIETVVLPNMNTSQEDGSEDSELHASGEMGTAWNQFIRVWYR